MRRLTRRIPAAMLAALWLIVTSSVTSPSASAQPEAPATAPALPAADASVPNIATLRDDLIRLPLATVLGAALALDKEEGTAVNWSAVKSQRLRPRVVTLMVK